LPEKKPAIDLSALQVIVLQGDDTLSIRDEISRINAQPQTGFTDLNLSRMDGAVATVSELAAEISMLPLGGGKRIVILDKGEEFLGREKAKEQMLALLESFPPSALLVFTLNDEKKYRSGDMVWQRFSGRHWFRKAVGKFNEGLLWKEFPLPLERDMPGWIMDKADKLGGKFEPGAAVVLAGMVGNDLFQAAHEIEKAIAYAGEEGDVSSDMVRLLCAVSKEEDIFALVDAVGQKKGNEVFRLLQALSVDNPPEYIFTMLVRQIRMLILTKETLLRKGSEKDVMEACGITHSFIARKLTGQSRHFSLAELKDIYRELNQIDESTKIGRSSLDVEIETLLAGIVL